MDHDKENDGRYVVTINVRLSEMLARLRGYVQTYKRREEAAEDVEEPEGGATKTTFSTEFEHGFAIIEDHDRAALQLSNYTRAYALATEGRNWIERKDLAMSVKIMLSTAPMARVKVFRLLIKNAGLLTTSHIAKELNVSNHTAKRTMTEFRGLGIADMERSQPDKSTSEYSIELKSKFDWFLKPEFEQLLQEAEST
jgi:predicted transcriptional regulator